MTRHAPTQTHLPPDLRQPFERLVEAAADEFGPIPLAQLMAAHLPLFRDLCRRGASWAQIVDLLAAREITREGRPFTEAVVRATYSRVCAAASANAAHRNETQKRATQRNPVKQKVTGRKSDGDEERDPRPIGPKRNTADRNDAAHDETKSALHRRAALLNLQNRWR